MYRNFQSKLVRDNLPQIIEEKNKQGNMLGSKHKKPVYMVLKNFPYLHLRELKNKLVEEAKELHKIDPKLEPENFLEELSDVLEVVECIKICLNKHKLFGNYSLENLEIVKSKKRKEIGSFKEGVYLLGDDYAIDDE